MTADVQVFDEKAALKDLRGQAQRLIRLLEGIAKNKPGTDPLTALQEALTKLPPADVFGQAVAELAVQGSNLLSQASKARVQAFGRIESAFLREVAAAGHSVRELDSGWRIGPLEYQFQRQQSQAQVLFNRQVLIKWSPVASLEDLMQLAERAESLLRKFAQPDIDLPDLFRAAHEHAVDQRRRAGTPSPGRVPALDLLVALRIVLVIRELQGQKPDRKLGSAEMPMWALLYNLDRYRSLAVSIPEGQRLAFETGSQRESQTMGVTVNGLEAHRDYQIICYVVSAGGERHASTRPGR